jgi:hypothetical protein
MLSHILKSSSGGFKRGLTMKEYVELKRIFTISFLQYRKWGISPAKDRI